MKDKSDMINRRISLIKLFKLAQAKSSLTNRGVLVDRRSFIDAINGRSQEPSVKVKPISVQTNNEN